MNANAFIRIKVPFVLHKQFNMFSGKATITEHKVFI